ncbi:hypothetical protein AaE_012682, partial [Aphanomyces astaci]
LLGLKLSADKTPTTLNAWWIAYSKTKGGEVWSEIHDSFVDQFCCSTPRDHVDNLIEASERYMDEAVKAYAIRLQTILDEVDFPASKGVAMFKRGVLPNNDNGIQHLPDEDNGIQHLPDDDYKIYGIQHLPDDYYKTFSSGIQHLPDEDISFSTSQTTITKTYSSVIQNILVKAKKIGYAVTSTDSGI